MWRPRMQGSHATLSEEKEKSPWEVNFTLPRFEPNLRWFGGRP